MRLLVFLSGRRPVLLRRFPLPRPRQSQNLYEAFEAGQWGSRCYSSKQSLSLFERERMRQHASNPAAGYEVGVTNAVTRKVLMRIGQGSDLTIHQVKPMSEPTIPH